MTLREEIISMAIITYNVKENKKGVTRWKESEAKNNTFKEM